MFPQRILDKGARWMADISEELESSSFGILCLTKDNIHAPWLIFEAGALSKSVEGSRVAPFLFGVELSEMTDSPLIEFQATRFDKDDVKKLLDSLNTAGDTPLLREDLLNDAFDTWWPKLEDKLDEIKVPEPEAEEGTPSFQGKAADTSSQPVQQDAEEAKRLSGGGGGGGGDGTEQGQERLKNAIEHLGHNSASVRLSGAYELFHLARDTPDFRLAVLDILCAHIRQTTDEPEYRKDYECKPSEEIQSLLTLLSVQKHEVFTGLAINLQGSWLSGSNLREARLEKANLSGAQLHRANLWGAQLHRANLWGAQLHGANLWAAQLHGANLWAAQLHGAFLQAARLHGADLRGAELHEANLRDAQLHGANLLGAELHGADLAGVLLHGASSYMRKLSEPFEASINGRIGEQSDLSRAIFAGGLTPKDVASIGKGLPDGEAKRLREGMEAHIGKPASHELPEKSGAIIGAYTKEEAARWIAEYKTALSAVSGGG